LFSFKEWISALPEVDEEKIEELFLRLYLSGKISHCKDYKAIFAVAKRNLEKAGYEVISPTCLGIPDDTTWEAAMKKYLQAELICDGVALLFNWHESKGAVIEAALASDIGMPVKLVERWVAESAEHNKKTKRRKGKSSKRSSSSEVEQG
jgi:hypothetical protein